MQQSALDTRLRVKRSLDGFTAVLPGHWLLDLVLRSVRFLSGGICFVLGEIVAIGLSLLLCVPISMLTEVLGLFDVLWLLVPVFVIVAACLGAAYGRKLSHWVFDRVEDLRERHRQPLSVQGDLMRLGTQRVPLTEVCDVQTRGRQVIILMNDGTREVLAAPLETSIRDWLHDTLKTILGQRDRGDIKDIPQEMAALKQEQLP